MNHGRKVNQKLPFFGDGLLSGVCFLVFADFGVATFPFDVGVDVFLALKLWDTVACLVVTAPFDATLLRLVAGILNLTKIILCHSLRPRR